MEMWTHLNVEIPLAVSMVSLYDLCVRSKSSLSVLRPSSSSLSAGHQTRNIPNSPPARKRAAASDSASAPWYLLAFHACHAICVVA